MSMSENTKFSGLSYKLKQAQHILRIRMDDALKPLGLTTPQYAVLSQLELKPGISNAALARASFVTAQTMHGIVSNLEKNNLVKRKCDPQHGRILCTELTRQGLEIVRQAHTLIDEVEKTMTRSMGQKDKSLLEKLLVECIKNLGTSVTSGNSR
jgi:DNA-binding MarR family transcriptional regulator